MISDISNFLCACWLSVDLWKMSIQFLCPYFNWVVCLLFELNDLMYIQNIKSNKLNITLNTENTVVVTRWKGVGQGICWWMEAKFLVVSIYRVGWHQQFDGYELEQTPGDGEGQGNLVCCSLWVARVGHDLVKEK